MTTFTGFEPANTTPVPDTLFDVLLPQLSGSELKVLLYIIRRTHGFKKETDAISLSQFTDGIKTRDGRQLDYGCGIKNRTVVSKALTDLVSKGCIYCTKGKDPSGDAAITVYAIRFNEGVVTKPYHPSIENVPPVVSKTYHGSNQSVPGVVSKTYPQETVLQDTDKQETVLQEERNVAIATARSQSSPSSQEIQDDETVKREAVKPSQKDTTHGTSVHSAPGSSTMGNARAASGSGNKRQNTNTVGSPPAPDKSQTNQITPTPHAKPVEPLKDMPWGTRKCLQWFDYWRGGILIAKYKLMEASRCAKGLAEQFDEATVIQIRDRMAQDAFWMERGGPDVCDVANNIHKELNKKQASSNSHTPAQPPTNAFIERCLDKDYNKRKLEWMREENARKKQAQAAKGVQ